jgi:MoaA/NifB/PqqE/SkfB family radical SAM enzyme
MKAKNLTGKSPGGKRENLIDNLPLDTPYIVQVFPYFGCNFSCNFCSFKYLKKSNYFKYESNSMDFNLYKKCVDDATKFKNKIKVWRIVGVGEPCLWKYLPEAIEYTKNKNIAETIEIITNGSLLNKKLSDNLIKGGLDRLIISVQGLNSETYKNISGVNLNFEKFIDNIRYFYENKKQCHIYIKIADIALKTIEDKNKFYKIFENICDSFAIESIVNMHNDIEYTDDINFKKITQFGMPINEKVEICPLPFYFMEFRVNGDVTVCYNFESPFIVGNINNESLYDIWFGKKFNEFRYNMIENTKNINNTCNKCSMISYRWNESDNLDDHKKSIEKFYK